MVSFRKTPTDAVEIARAAAWPIVAGRTYDRIVNWIGDASVVLLGAATEGTHDFVAARAALTRRLIEERGFMAVAMTGDAEDACRVNRYVHGLTGREPAEVFAEFVGFPNWMWRNTAMAEFAAWLHELNTGREIDHQVGFYGLDAYGSHGALRRALEQVDQVAPAASLTVRARCTARDQVGEDEPAGPGSAMAERVVALAIAELTRDFRDPGRPGPCDASGQVEQAFYDEHRNELRAGAVAFFEALLGDRAAAWSARSRHVADTLHRLQAYLSRLGLPPKIVVWGNNAQLGDARAAEFAGAGFRSLGQWTHERLGAKARSIGFTTFAGTVTAASEWGGAGDVRTLEPALPESMEYLLHAVGLPRFFLPLSTGADVRDVLLQPRLERGVGFVYRPEQERWNHYYRARASEQFDAILHVDATHALEPLEHVSEWDPAISALQHPVG